MKLLRFFKKRKPVILENETEDIIKEFESKSEEELNLLKIDLESKFESLKVFNVSLVTLTIVVTLYIAAMNRLIMSENELYSLLTDILFVIMAFYIINKVIAFSLSKTKSLESTVKKIKIIEAEIEKRETQKNILEKEQEKTNQRKQGIIEYRKQTLNKKYLK